MPLSKREVMWESAYRTFLIAALPAFGTSLAATNGSYGRAAIWAAVGTALMAGLAAVGRAVVPIKTDAAGVSVIGVEPNMEGLKTYLPPDLGPQEWQAPKPATTEPQQPAAGPARRVKPADRRGSSGTKPPK